MGMLMSRSYSKYAARIRASLRAMPLGMGTGLNRASSFSNSRSPTPSASQTALSPVSSHCLTGCQLRQSILAAPTFLQRPMTVRRTSGFVCVPG